MERAILGNGRGMRLSSTKQDYQKAEKFLLVEVHQFYGTERYLSWKEKEMKGLRADMLIENERVKKIKASV